jgi:uncharacterized membrane protein YidH (DUF202 family)
MSSPTGEPADRGGASERTRLSWRRTSLTVTVVVLLLGRFALEHRQDAPTAIAVVALAAICWVTTLVAIQRRVHSLPATLRSTGALLPVAAACLILAALGVVLVVS